MRELDRRVQELADGHLRDGLEPGRPYLLTWFGAVGRNPAVWSEPTLEVLFTPLGAGVEWEEGLDPGRDLDAHASRRIALGVGLLPALAIGQVWKSERIVGSPSYTRAEFAGIRFSAGHCRLVRDSGLVEVATPTGSRRVPLLPYEQFPLTPRAEGANGLGARCLSLDVPGERVRLLVPCAEIVRFYYADSSVLARDVFGGFSVDVAVARWSDGEPPPLTDLYDSEFSYLDDGTAHLRLRARMRDADAPSIGRLAFSAQARRAALFVWESLQLGGAGEPVMPAALPPVRGSTTLGVRGVWLDPSGGGEARYFLVFQIENCTGSFPFDSLVYTRENDARRGEGGVEPVAEDDVAESFRLRAPRAATNAALRQDREPARGVSPATFNLDRDRFVALRGIPIDKPPKGNVRGGRVVRPAASAEEPVAVGTGAGTWGDSPVEPIVVDQGGPSGDDDSAAVRGVQSVGLAEFREVLDVLAARPEIEVEVRAVETFGPADRLYSASSVPANDRDRKPAWAYLDRERRRRRHVLIGEVQTDGAWMYAFEIERRRREFGWEHEEGYRTLLVADRSGVRLEDADLARILRWCVDHRGRWGERWELREFRSTSKHPNKPELQESGIAYTKSHVRILSRELVRLREELRLPTSGRAKS